MTKTRDAGKCGKEAEPKEKGQAHLSRGQRAGSQHAKVASASFHLAFATLLCPLMREERGKKIERTERFQESEREREGWQTRRERRKFGGSLWPCGLSLSRTPLLSLLLFLLFSLTLLASPYLSFQDGAQSVQDTHVTTGMGSGAYLCAEARTVPACPFFPGRSVGVDSSCFPTDQSVATT